MNHPDISHNVGKKFSTQTVTLYCMKSFFIDLERKPKIGCFHLPIHRLGAHRKNF